MEVLRPPIQKTSTCLTLPSPAPDLSKFRRLDELGLVVTGQRLEPGRAVLARRVLETGGFRPQLHPRIVKSRETGCEARA
jgi:hypothetical protein